MEELTVFEVNELVASVQNLSAMSSLNRKSIQVDIFILDGNDSSITKKVCPHIHILPTTEQDYHIN